MANSAVSQLVAHCDRQIEAVNDQLEEGKGGQSTKAKVTPRAAAARAGVAKVTSIVDPP